VLGVPNQLGRAEDAFLAEGAVGLRLDEVGSSVPSAQACAGYEWGETASGTEAMVAVLDPGTRWIR